MQDNAFEWDGVKAARNLRNHGVTFAFKDAFALEWFDDAQHAHEERYCMLATVENRLLFVSYALRGDRIRIISARKADSHERRRYYEENREA